MMQSIVDRGMIQPIGVRTIANSRYCVVFGDVRLEAARAAKLDSVPALVFEVDDDGALELLLTENLLRTELNPIDEARLISVLSERKGINSTARRVARTERTIELYRARNSLPPCIQRGLARAGLKGRHATALVRLTPWPKIQGAFYEKLLQLHPTTVVAELAVRALLTKIQFLPSSADAAAAMGALGFESLDQLFVAQTTIPNELDDATLLPNNIVLSHAAALARDLRKLALKGFRLTQDDVLTNRLTQIHDCIGVMLDSAKPVSASSKPVSTM